MKRTGRTTSSSNNSSLPAISLTPLIDTVLVLLVIFMVTTPGKQTPQAQPLLSKLPEVSEEDKKLYKALTLEINNKGTLLLENRIVKEKALVAEVQKLLKDSVLRIIRVVCDDYTPYSILQSTLKKLRTIEDVKIVFW